MSNSGEPDGVSRISCGQRWHVRLVASLLSWKRPQRRVAPILFNSGAVYLTRVICLLSVVYLCAIVGLFGVDVPRVDQWEMIPLIDQHLSNGVSFSDLWRQHNEHRIVFPKIIMLSLAASSRWNIRAEMWVNVACGVGIAGIVGRLLRRSRIDCALPVTPELCFPLAVLLVLSLSQQQNWLWGWQMTILLNVLSVMVGIYCLTSRVLGWGNIFISTILGIIASLCFANGLLFWIVGMGVLCIRQRNGTLPQGRLISYCLFWATVSVGMWVAYLKGYEKPIDHPSLLAAAAHPGVFGGYVCAYLGCPIMGYLGAIEMHTRSPLPFHLFGLVPGTGLLGLVIISVVSWNLAKTRKVSVESLLPYWALSGYAILSALVSGIGRVGFGMLQACESRYITISNLLWISLIVLVDVMWRFRPAGWWERAWTAGLGVNILCFSAIGTVGAIRSSHEIQQARELLAVGRIDEPIVSKRVHLKPEVIRERLPILKTRQLSLFRGKDPSNQ